MLAASAASALPIVTASARCSRAPCPAAGHDGNRHRLAHRRGDLQIVAILGAVGVHAGQHDLAGAQLFDLPGPGDRFQARADRGRR